MLSANLSCARVGFSIPGPGQFLNHPGWIEATPMPTHHFTSLFVEAVLLAATIVKAQSGPDVSKSGARVGNSNLTVGDLPHEEGGKTLHSGYEFSLRLARLE